MILNYCAFFICISFVSPTELYDVTTIYRLDEPSGGIENDTGPTSVEIHSRTNALGLPFLAGGNIAEPSVGIDIPRCEALYLNSVTCDWELDNFEWGSHAEAPLIDTGEWTEFHVIQSSNRFYRFDDILFIQFSGLIPSRSYLKIILSANTGFLQEQEEFYFLQLSNYFGRILYRCDNRVFDRLYRFKDLDGEIVSAYCQRVGSFEGNNRWTYDAVFKNYLIIEIKNGRIQMWDNKLKAKPSASWLDPDPIQVNYFSVRGEDTGNSQIIATNYGKGQVLSMVPNAKVGSVKSPWITLSTNRICLSVVYYSQVSNTPTVLSVMTENGTSFELGVLKTEDNGWKVERLISSGLTSEDDSVQITLKSLKNEGVLEIQRIAGCNVEDDEEIAIITNDLAVRERIAYSVAVKSNNDIDKTDDSVRDDCENGGLGFGPNLCACPAGFTGDRCQTGCGANRYGADCGGLCSLRTQGCGYLTLCTPIVGCLCAPGFKGYYCNQTCDAQEYGAGCDQKCSNCEGNCDRYTGACYTSCLPGFYPPYCKKLYSYTRYAPQVNASDFGEVSVVPDLENPKGEGNPAFFQVQYKLSQDYEWIIYSTHSVPQADEIFPDLLIQGLEYGKSYQVRVVLIDSDLNSYQGVLIPYAEFLSKCSVPEEINYELTGMASEDNIIVSWKFDVNDPYICPVLSYEISWKEGWRWISRNISTSSAELLRKLPGTEYKVKVRALTTSEYAPYSETISVRTKKQVPDPVTDLHLEYADYNSVRLKWKEVDDYPSSMSYNVIFKCLKHAACDLPCDSSGEAHSMGPEALISGLQPLSQYKVMVRVDGIEPSGNTSLLVATKQSVPKEVPKESTVEPIRSNTSFTVFWEMDTVCSGFMIGYNYELFLADGPQTVISSGSTKEKNATFEDLSPRTRYIVHIYVLTSGGWNPQNFLEIFVTTRATVPDRVQDLTVYKRSRFMLGLRWAEPNMTYGTLEAFTIEYTVGEEIRRESVQPKHCVVWPDLFCHDIQGLQPDQFYTVNVSARNSEIAADGEPASVTGFTKESAPDPPENLQIINVTSTTVTIQWDYPSLAKGLIRSFLLGVEETEQLDSSKCCQLFPVTEYPVLHELEHYQTDIIGLQPASTYAVSISGKTVLIGSGESLIVYTRPPHLGVIHLPSVSVNVTWDPVEHTKDDFTIYLQLIKGYILLLLTEGEEPSIESSGITDENLYSELAAAINFASFKIIAEYEKDETVEIKSSNSYEGKWGQITEVSLVEGRQYSLAAAQILQYFGLFSIDVQFSTPFTFSSEPESFKNEIETFE